MYVRDRWYVAALSEDLVILEGQQTRRASSRPTIDLNADAGTVQARLVLDRLMPDGQVEA